MKSMFKLITAAAILLAVIFTGCFNKSGEKKLNELESLESERSEHSRDVGENGEGEEDGTEYSKSDVCDVVIKGTHLVLRYDAESNSFVGTVENTTDKLIQKVRVEVHLSNGIELGPTTPMDLKPGEKITVELKATEKKFKTWSTHAEVGSSEHDHEGGEGEHGREGEHR
jgi:predicted DNA-binding antitoxin AbrB/MazE fold protein